MICNKCEREQLEDCRIRKELRVLPHTLVIHLNVFDHESIKKPVSWQLPSSYNFGQYIYEDNEIDLRSGYIANLDEVYQLFGIIAVEGQSLEQASYVSLVKKFDEVNNTFLWFEFSFHSFKEISEEDALRNYQPFILFWRKSPQVLKLETES